MAGLFISYRRDDAAADVDRLFNDLTWRCRRDRVFMDRDIPGGADFKEVLSAKLETCDVLLAVIGPKWLDLTNPETGRRRLDDENDYVRMEVALALEKKKIVIPVILPEARFPNAEELPESIRALAGKNAFDLRRSRRALDLNDLVKQFPLSAGCGQELTIEGAGRVWVYLLLVSIAVLTSVHVFAVFWLPVDARLLSAALSFLLGAGHTFQFRLVRWAKLLIGVGIAVGSVVLDSVIVPLLGEESIIPQSAAEVREFALFVALILAAYLAGAVLADGLLSRGKDRRGPR